MNFLMSCCNTKSNRSNLPRISNLLPYPIKCVITKDYLVYISKKSTVIDIEIKKVLDSSIKSKESKQKLKFLYGLKLSTLDFST